MTGGLYGHESMQEIGCSRRQLGLSGMVCKKCRKKVEEEEGEQHI